MTDPGTPLPWNDRPDRYGRISLILHWSTALAVVALIALGLLMEWTITFEDQSLYATIKYAHISTGVVLTVLVLPRVVWRLRSGWPRAQIRSRALRILARLVPSLLLAGVVVQAVTGVLARWTARDWPGEGAAPLPLFGAIEFPSPFGIHRPEWNGVVEDTHGVTADIVLILLAIHVLAAVGHWSAGRLQSRARNASARLRLKPN